MPDDGPAPQPAPAGALVPLPRPAPLGVASPAARLAATFFAGRSPQTLRAYLKDLEDFAAFAGWQGTEGAARMLLAGGQGRANELALAYRADLLARGLSPAT